MVGRDDVQSVIESIVAKLVASYKPHKVILFGSQARGGARPDSDIDLFIIKDTKERMIDRCVEVRRIVSDPKRLTGLEIIVLTPYEVSSRIAVGDQFIAEIIENGTVLYAS
ncbi:MAG: nucleotidyltransferase domain-containing protein [Candidatus Coatesbacteria bacterium]|nr:MAG: nucleotidyltransferase domain-containing protein [Candidatus Coatesbacteria bacterium]HDM59394.1 nucleotidyltransferase domain-containing protein [Bacillota bacterium]